METVQPRTRVAGVILYREGRVLLQQRDDRPDIVFPGKWAFFGGHLEPGEGPEEGARREIEEELCLRLEGPLTLACHDLDAERERFIFAAPLPVPPEALTQMEGQGMALLGPDEWETYPLVPAHRRILKQWVLDGKPGSGEDAP